MVAEQEEAVVGPILFPAAQIVDGSKKAEGMGLRPRTVLPERQRKGIGSALVRAGPEELRRAGVRIVVVAGPPWFYPKFGFEKAQKYAARCEYDSVPDEAFMIAVFPPEGFQGLRGIAGERPEFAAVS
jgi:putative acetyltransferase